jgi:hypothetical protein
MRNFCNAAFFAACALLVPVTAPSAAILGDPLLSYSCSGAGTGCAQTDNGTFAPLSSANWGFEIAPGPATGNLTLGIFVPTNEINASTYALPTLNENGSALGAFLKIGALLNVGDGSSIATFLGLPNAGSFSPTDNFANLSAGEGVENPGFGGNFLAFKITLNGVTLDGNGSSTLLQDFMFGSNLPAGAVIVAFFNETVDAKGVACTNNCFIGTAASNDLVVTPQLLSTPLPSAVWLFGSAIAGLGLLSRRRKTRKETL